MTPGPGISRTPLPKGFTASGINCGVRKYRPDLGIIMSDRDAVAAGVFTKNEAKAAPVLYSQAMLPSAHIRAIVTNSGQANAATGEAGTAANRTMAEAAAQWVGCRQHQILTASTGVIGVAMEIDKIAGAMQDLVDKATSIAEPFALSILTTDLVPKSVTTEVPLSGGTVRITGICKGSGMIHPNMATMLGYLLTDAAIPQEIVKSLLLEATEVSFNMISVDGDTSTNDCVFLLANGASGVGIANDADLALLKQALVDVSQVLAKSIARDGEGADKLIEVRVSGASSLALARAAARGITVSPLIKCAMHGADPNWGRILAKLGSVGVPSASLEKMKLDVQGFRLFEGGGPVAFDRSAVRVQLWNDTVEVAIDLASGDYAATAWGCDLSKRYVDINAEYST